MSNPTEDVEALPLIFKRKMLGYLIPAFNLPLLMLNVHQTYIHINSGMPTNSVEFLNDILFILIPLGLSLILPWWAPVYESKYKMEKDHFVIKRFLRKSERIKNRL